MTTQTTLMTDLELLQDYAQRRSDAAFAQLVARHADWVYSAALRMVRRDAHLADDVTQAVFLLLSQKAAGLVRSPGGDERPLVAWMFRTVHYCAANAARAKTRRQRHERRAAEMSGDAGTPDSGHQLEWEEIAAKLDGLVWRLRPQDRDVLLLRFYQRKTMAAVGAAMGVSEEAAKKRVGKAVENLRRLFERSGSVSLPAAVLVAPLLANTTQAAPPAVVASCSIPGAAAPAAIGIAKGAVILMATAKTKAILAGAVAAILLIGVPAGVVLVNRASTNPAQRELADVQPAPTALRGRLPSTTRVALADMEETRRRRIRCAANLRQIGQALLLYANDNRGNYPPDLAALVRTTDIALSCFVCPNSGAVEPPNGAAMGIAERGNWVMANSDYEYIPGFTYTAGREFVVAYEREENEFGDGINLLFGDGQVEFVLLPAARQMIENSMARRR